MNRIRSTVGRPLIARPTGRARNGDGMRRGIVRSYRTCVVRHPVVCVINRASVTGSPTAALIARYSVGIYVQKGIKRTRQANAVAPRQAGSASCADNYAATVTAAA